MERRHLSDNNEYDAPANIGLRVCRWYWSNSRLPCQGESKTGLATARPQMVRSRTPESPARDGRLGTASRCLSGSGLWTRGAHATACSVKSRSGRTR